MRPPTTGSGSLTAVLPAGLTAVEGGDPAPLHLERRPTGVVVVVIDGLGQALLDDHADLAPTLASAPGPTLDATFPTTTPTNLTSLGTGLTPIEHGITGTGIGVPGHERTLISLTWRWDHQFEGPDARDEVPPEAFQPCPTVFARARGRGVRATTVLRPEFATSGLTRAGLRDGTVVTASDLETTLEVAVDAASPGPSLVYAHHGDLDAAGHLAGPGSDAWCAELARIDAVLERCRQQLPPDVALVVTADHGMVRVDDTGFVDLADRADLLEGVRVLGGDPRARQLHVVAGAVDDVAARWREHAGDAARVVTRDEAIGAGWHGPRARLRDGVGARIGDLLVVATAEVAWIHRDRDPLGGRLPGQHGALTDAELRVPARTLRRSP